MTKELPTRVARNDSSKKLRGDFQRYQQALFPGTDGKKFPQRHCRVCQKRIIRKDLGVFC